MSICASTDLLSQPPAILSLYACTLFTTSFGNAKTPPETPPATSADLPRGSLPPRNRRRIQVVAALLPAPTIPKPTPLRRARAALELLDTIRLRPRVRSLPIPRPILEPVSDSAQCARESGAERFHPRQAASARHTAPESRPKDTCRRSIPIEIGRASCRERV